MHDVESSKKGRVLTPLRLAAGGQQKAARCFACASTDGIIYRYVCMTIEVKASVFLSFRAETCRLNEPMLNLELIGPLQGTGYGPSQTQNCFFS